MPLFLPNTNEHANGTQVLNMKRKMTPTPNFVARQSGSSNKRRPQTTNYKQQTTK